MTDVDSALPITASDELRLSRRELALIVAFWSVYAVLSVASRIFDRGSGGQFAGIVVVALAEALCWMLITLNALVLYLGVVSAARARTCSRRYHLRVGGTVPRAFARQLLSWLVLPLLLGIAHDGRAQPEPRRGQARLRGQIVDVQSHAPIASAQLLLLRSADTVARGLSDSLGQFTASGTYGEPFTLEIRRLGYVPVAVRWTPSAADTAVVIAMTAVPRALDAVAVVDRGPTSVRVSGFEARAGTKAGGTYILREQIDAWHPRRTSDLMRRVSGVRLIDSSGTVLAASSRGEKVDLKAVHAARSWAPCVMRVGVDGQVKEWGFPMDTVDPNDIHGIEVYNGPASMPSEFAGLRTDSYCGLVMIWTRSGH